MSSPINFTLMDKELSKPFFASSRLASSAEESKPFSFSSFSKSLSSALPPQPQEDNLEIAYSALHTLNYVVDSDFEFSDTESESSTGVSRSSSVSIVSTSPIDSSLAEADGEEDSGTGEKSVVLFKTEMCKSFQETGACRYGKRCKFAHGEQEQRMVHRHPKYKTQLCRNFKEKGSCPYGQRCCYRHQY